MGNIMLKSLFLLLMGCNQLIALSNHSGFLPENGFFYTIILLFGCISQLLQLSSSLFNTIHSTLLHFLKFFYFFIDFCQILLQFSLNLLSLFLDGICIMVLMASIDEALSAYKGVITGLAYIHDGLFLMPIASPLKITIKTMVHLLSFLSVNILSIKDVLLFFCDQSISPHQFDELFVKFIINLSDFPTSLASNTIYFSLFLPADLIKCTRQTNTVVAAENHDVFRHYEAGTAFFFITHNVNSITSAYNQMLLSIGS